MKIKLKHAPWAGIFASMSLWLLHLCPNSPRPPFPSPAPPDFSMIECTMHNMCQLGARPIYDSTKKQKAAIDGDSTYALHRIPYNSCRNKSRCRLVRFHQSIIWKDMQNSLSQQGSNKTQVDGTKPSLQHHRDPKIWNFSRMKSSRSGCPIRIIIRGGWY